MKHFIFLLIGAMLLLGCKQTAVEKPDNLIDEAVMENIIYDLSLLEAIKSSNPISLKNKNITPGTYIYTKYKIDSLQFANSNHYYASDVHNYLKMYKRVEARLEANKAKFDTLVKKEQKVDKKEKRDKKAIKPITLKDTVRRNRNLMQKFDLQK